MAIGNAIFGREGNRRACGATCSGNQAGFPGNAELDLADVK